MAELKECDYCRGTGLRGANGTTADHVGHLVTCTKCKGTGKVPEDTEAGGSGPGELEQPAAEEAIHTPTEEEADKPSILSRMTGGRLG